MIADKPTVLGLDLKRRHRARLPGPADAADARGHAGGDRPRDRDHPQAHRHARRLRARDLAASATTEIQVGLPNVQNAEQAIKQIGTTAQLYFYDFEPNVIPPRSTRARGSDDAPTTEPQRSTRSPTSTRRSSSPRSESRVLEQRSARPSGPTYYLFDASARTSSAGPAESAERPLREPAAAARRSADTDRSCSPSRRERSCVEAQPKDDPTHLRASTSSPTAPQFFVLHDRPALTGTDITDPKQGFDPMTNQPNVNFNFTDAGRDGVPERDPADRPARGRGLLAATGRRAADPSTRPTSTRSTSRSSSTASSSSRPIINFVDNPDGIDGRTGAQISGSFSDQEAQDLAERPEDRRPADQARADQPEHRLGDARPAGARPGPQGRRRRASCSWSCSCSSTTASSAWSPSSACSSTRSSSSP